jgi:hypothetical protein
MAVKGNFRQDRYTGKKLMAEKDKEHARDLASYANRNSYWITSHFETPH